MTRRQPRSPRDLVSLDIDARGSGRSHPASLETIARAIQFLLAEHRSLTELASDYELRQPAFKAWSEALETTMHLFADILRREGAEDLLKQAIHTRGYPHGDVSPECDLILTLGKRPKDVLRRWELQSAGLSREEIMLRMTAELFGVATVTKQELLELLRYGMLPEQHPLASCTCPDCQRSGRRPRPPKLPPHETPRQ